MTPDPDHVRVVELSLHTVLCWPGQVPYERYAKKHREDHRKIAELLLTSLGNAGYALTTKEA